MSRKLAGKAPQTPSKGFSLKPTSDGNEYKGKSKASLMMKAGDTENNGLSGDSQKSLDPMGEHSPTPVLDLPQCLLTGPKYL